MDDTLYHLNLDNRVSNAKKPSDKGKRLAKKQKNKYIWEIMWENKGKDERAYGK